MGIGAISACQISGSISRRLRQFMCTHLSTWSKVGASLLQSAALCKGVGGRAADLDGLVAVSKVGILERGAILSREKLGRVVVS